MNNFKPDPTALPAFDDMADLLEQACQAADHAAHDDREPSTQERRALAHRVYTQLIDLLTEVEDLINPEPEED